MKQLERNVTVNSMSEFNDKLSKSTITSFDLLAQINFFRLEENNKKELRHYDLLRIIRDEFEEEIRDKKISESVEIRQLPQGGSSKYPYFELSFEQAKQVLIRESKFVRKAMIQYIDNLENELRRALQPQSKLPSYAEALRELADKVEENEQLRIECNNEKERSSRLCGNNIAIAKRYCETIDQLETSLGCYKDELEYKEKEISNLEKIAYYESSELDKKVQELTLQNIKYKEKLSKLEGGSTALDLSQYRETYATIPEVTRALPCWRGDGKINPSDLKLASEKMRLRFIKVVNEYGKTKNTINSYHKDVWMNVYGIDINFFAKTGGVEF